MSVFRFADCDSYSISYDLDTYEGEMRFTSSEQMRYVIKRMQQFLDKMEEGDFVDAVEEAPEEFAVVIKEDRMPRERVLRSTPFVDRQVCQRDEESLVTNFNIGVNDLCLNGLSAGQLKCIVRKLEGFLNIVNEKWRE